MELIKVKTARFRDIVAQTGKPEVVTLWQDPKKNPAFQRAQRESRVMSVYQAAVGTKKDFAEVGFVTGPNVTHLLFPKSLKQFADRRIVGIDYSLIEDEGPKRPARAVKAEPATQTTTRPKAAGRGTKRSSTPAFEVVRKVEEAPEIIEAPPEPALDPFMVAAIEEARKGLAAGGIPTGAALVRNGKLISVGRNKRVQDNDPIAHAETDCLRNAGRLGSYRGCTLYSTLMPCYLCAGAAVQFGIKKIVVGESRTFQGSSEFMRAHGIEVIDLDLAECHEMVSEFIRKHPKVWNEDLGIV